MNVLILTNSKISSGAGVIAKNFKEALENQGVGVKILVNQYSEESEDVINMQSPSETRLISFIRELVHNKLVKNTLLKGILLFSKIFKYSNSFVFKSIHKSKYSIQDVDQTKSIYKSELLYTKISNFKPDAIIVLFMQNFVNYKNLYDLREYYDQIPICVSLLDMAPITGGCHYTWDCLGYQNNCKSCPAVPTQFNQKIENNLKFKNHYATEGDFNFIYSSEYQKDVLDKSVISSVNRKYKIPLPTNEKYFFNNEQLRENTRIELGYNIEDIVLFFGAMNLTDPRKGGTLLFEIVKEMIDNEELNRLKFLIIGSNSQKFKEFIPKNRLICLDMIPPSDLPKYYNVADLFLSPSIEDAGPMMVNQSLMCGTRVCAFEIGVALDMIKPNKECGRCSKNIDSEDLYESIRDEVLFQQKNNRDSLRKKCAETAFPITSKSAVSEKWITTLNTILKEQEKNVKR
ncbi:glycosyltransferase [Aquimarina algiphila]|uniref:glycosyltransferase n=1 Tax=Aquimarina algiphila TaxID=2047982 RepID=UPI00232B19E6|nr:glycosyltransferase [Aquimarina algiphila]